jgi:hypothetical protein
MAQGDSSLRVPTQTVRVEVAFPSAPPRLFELFAPSDEANRPARARVADLLERDPRFLPARETETGVLVALGTHAIAWLGVPLARTDDVFDEDDLFDHRRDVQITLGDGSQLSGELLYSAPASGTRVLDVLNAGARFLPLWLSDRVLFVNKARVWSVSEVPHVPRATLIAPPRATLEPAPPSPTKTTTRKSPGGPTPRRPKATGSKRSR